MNLASIQLRITDINRRENIQKEVSDYLKGALQGLGFIEKSFEKGEPPDLVCFVGADRGTAWLPVYVQGRMFESLESLSAQFLTTAVYAEIIASSTVFFSRFDKGNQIDDYSNDPFQFQFERWYSEKPQWPSDETQIVEYTRGNPSKWADIVDSEYDVEEIEMLWSDEPVFADDAFWETCDIFGFDTESMAMVDEALYALSCGAKIDDNSNKGKFLTFEYSQIPSYKIEVSGAPKFTMEQSAEADHRCLTDGFNYSLSVNNQGGEGQGLKIRMWGSVLDEGALSITDVKISRFFDKEGEMLNGDSRFVQANMQEILQLDNDLGKRRQRIANFPEHVFYAGLKHGYWECQNTPGFNLEKAMNEYSKTTINFGFRGSLHKTGEYELFFSFEPDDGNLDEYEIFRTLIDIEEEHLQ